MSGHSTRAARALAHLPETDPALAALALWCAHRDGAGRHAARTEGETIVYGTAFEALPLQEQVGLAGHHVLHVALRHAPRMAGMAARLGEGFDGRLYGLAADGIVNTALELAGHALPRPAVVLPELLLLAGLPATGPEAALAAWDVDRLYLRLARSGAAARAQLADYADASGFAEDLAPEGATGEEDARAPDWQGHLTRALSAGRRAGRGIGTLAGGIGDLPAPAVPWERHLRGLVEQAAGDAPRRSHRRPAGAWVAAEAAARARGGPVPVFEPGRSRDGRRPRIAVGLDTSGSIPDDLLDRFAAEIDGIVRRTGAELHLLAFDETVHHAEVLAAGQAGRALRAAAMRRGGGTAFGDVVAAAVSRQAAIAVILTDLAGRFGPPPKAMPVLWAVPEPPAAAPPFGRVLLMAR